MRIGREPGKASGGVDDGEALSSSAFDISVCRCFLVVCNESFRVLSLVVHIEVPNYTGRVRDFIENNRRGDIMCIRTLTVSVIHINSRKGIKGTKIN